MVGSSNPHKALRLGLVAAAVLGHRALVGDGCPTTSCRGGNRTLAVVTWNLENFPGDHDVAKMAARIADVDPDIVAFQEVLDAAALDALLPGRTAHVSERGGARGQRLGFAVDPEHTSVGPRTEHAALEHGGRVRPALSSHVRHGDVDFHLVVVHLKATPAGIDVRRTQWAALAELVAHLGSDGPGADDPDVIVVGDFNATGTDDMTAAEERDALGAVLGTVGLRLLAPEDGCSAYWDGRRRDAWLEPSLLDLVFVRGFADHAPRVRALGACAAHRCAPVRSTDAHPDPDVVATSDHCPVLLELAASG